MCTAMTWFFLCFKTPLVDPPADRHPNAIGDARKAAIWKLVSRFTGGSRHVAPQSAATCRLLCLPRLHFAFIRSLLTFLSSSIFRFRARPARMCLFVVRDRLLEHIKSNTIICLYFVCLNSRLWISRVRRNHRFDRSNKRSTLKVV